MGWDSSVSIALDYRLDGWDSIPSKGKILLYSNIQIHSRAHAESYPMGTRGSFPGDKVAGV
jgi:hypothetical protein